MKDIHLHVVDWHNHFDALLGSADLMSLSAKIDYESNTLQINNISLPFQYQYTSNKIQPYRAIGINTLTIPVSIENGDVIFPETKFSDDVIIPESIVTARNGFCTFPIDRRIDVNFF